MQPVDLTDLRDMTDGDRAMERELFSEFFISSEACIGALIASNDHNEPETWAATAHALKGSALNLGARALGALCMQAQEARAAPANEKRDMIAGIIAEYGKVKSYLTDL